jgi:hypothetical protein
MSEIPRQNPLEVSIDTLKHKGQEDKMCPVWD